MFPRLTSVNKGAAVAEWLSSWLAEQEDRGSIPGLSTWIFRDWLSPASKSRYGWKIAKSTLILKTTNQPTNKCKQVEMFENVHSTSQKHEILLRAVTKSDGSPTSEKQAMMQE